MANRTEIPLIALDPDTGDYVEGASVEIKNRADDTDATIYTTENGATEAVQPLATDAQGRVNGWLDRGQYVVEWTADAVTTHEPYDSVPARDGAVDSDFIAADAIDDTKIANDAIGNEHIQTDAVGASEIAAGAVGNGEISDGAVTSTKLGANSVDSTKLKSDASIDSNRAVATDHIRDSAVTTNKIADSNVTSAKLGTNAVTTTKISDSQITTAKLANDAVTNAKLAPLPLCLLGLTGNLASGSWTTASFTTEFADTDSMHSTSVNPSRITIQTNGYYRIVASTHYAGSLTSAIAGVLLKISDFPIQYDYKDATTTGYATCTVDLVAPLTSGVYITMDEYQLTGSPLNRTARLTAYMVSPS